ncbi:MAG: acetamidase/formamidase family protein, partial [Acidobacteria bacterium]|nr:acetamidase/formamidase family protein [Acidobacteriota bacterium]
MSKTHLLLALTCAALLHAQTIAGDWDLAVEQFGSTNHRRATLELSGEQLTGRYGAAKLHGTLRGGRIEFQVDPAGGNAPSSFTGVFDRNEMSGEAVLNDELKAKWKAQRIPTRPPNAPRRHVFEPTVFQRFFSGATPPVLRILPGDSVQTWSVDAGGSDKARVRRSMGGNPLTGPFYVEGAMPGDTLVVRLSRVRLNRDRAFSGNSITANALDPYYMARLKPPEKFDSSWRLDQEKGIAMLANPTERLKNYTVPLRPMLGCVGVAPPGSQTFNSGHLGPFGGNMDYNRMNEGTTLYLPVFQPGALLFLGDGHAAQGDGELTGGALETSMDIEFTVDVIVGQASSMPRAENDEDLMAIGVGGSLTDALQSATTGLARWLERDYKLNPAEVAVVLGTALRYDVGELVDPEISLVARISKR